MHVLLSCVTEDRPDFHARVESLVLSARDHAGSLAGAPFVVNSVESADPAFVERMRALDASVRIVPRFSERQGLGTGPMNKLRMLELAADHDFDVLLALDCDTVLTGDPAPHLPLDAVGVAPADVDPFGDRAWRRFFEGAGLPVPERSVVGATSGRPMYPYFNSGVVSVPGALCATLLEDWRAAKDDARWILADARTFGHDKRFFYDQWALMIALHRGVPWRVLDRALNFPTHVAVAPAAMRLPEPLILHYHAEVDPEGFLMRPRSDAAREAAERFNRGRAQRLGLAYAGMREHSRAARTQEWARRKRRRLRRRTKRALEISLLRGA